MEKLNLSPEQIKGEFIITDVKYAQAKNGPYAKFTMADNSKAVTATKWSLTDEEKALLQSQEILTIQGTGAVSSYSGNYEVNVEYLNTPSGEVDLKELVAVEPIDAEFYFKALLQIVEGFKNPILRDVTLAVLKDKEAYIKQASAALKMHHSKPHGLLRHISEMIRFAKSFGTAYPCDMELVISGIIFHDLEKKMEYNYTEYGLAKEMTPEGILFGHIVAGSKLPLKYAPQHQGSKELLMLEHIILSHHGKQEWGSPVTPATMEALVVHLADEASARMYQMEAALSELSPGEHRKFFGIGNVYKGV